MSKEILIYALPAGETECYTEVLISTQCKNQEQVDRIKIQAGVDGFHSFRITNFVPGTAPNFRNAITK